jgi:hypothetical protein
MTAHSEKTCSCGAIYERTVVTLPIKDIGAFECCVCSERLEIWHGRSVPVYRFARDGRERKTARSA